MPSKPLLQPTHIVSLFTSPLLPALAVLNTAPYEVTESGWGEFAIGITITFKDESGLDPVHLSHMLKLFPPPGQQASTKKPVMSEAYDEFVFVNPSKEWWDVLQSGPTRKVDNHPLINWCQWHKGKGMSRKAKRLCAVCDHHSGVLSLFLRSASYDC